MFLWKIVFYAALVSGAVSLVCTVVAWAVGQGTGAVLWAALTVLCLVMTLTLSTFQLLMAMLATALEAQQNHMPPLIAYDDEPGVCPIHGPEEAPGDREGDEWKS